MPLPSGDFDPTEAAVTWRVCSARGHKITFATPGGVPAAADDMMLTGRGLDPWGFVPGLDRIRLIGLLMRADSAGRDAYAAMRRDPAYSQPRRWREVSEKDFDGLILPGGHRARGMREYLESSLLQDLVVAFFRADKAVGAICHGVLLLARSIDPLTGRSVLWGRKTTALTWSMERLAGGVGRITRWWDPSYYRTYPDEPGEVEGYRSVEAEVKRALAVSSDFQDVSVTDPDRQLKLSGLRRDRIDDARPAFVVRDRNYVSARWPGDAHTFAKVFANVLEAACR
ncbi:MAG TPA: type 1 glutamine amidotransferase domain-containing protein [Methylocella sp.]|nr:type 1 glutamine amidotransferase domain-containing protein [Methylocella sp.]